MKRCKATVLLLISVLLLSGCGYDNHNDQAPANSSTMYNYITDSQLAFSGSRLNDVITVKGEEGYYSYQSKRIFYTDGQTLESTPLCIKPNCMHNTDTCNAFIGTTYNIAYNDGYIYYNQSGGVEHDLIGEQFYRMKADGSEKEKLWYLNYNIIDWVVHKGYLYCTCNMYLNTLDLETSVTNAYVFRIKLSDTKAEPEVAYFAEEVGQSATVSGIVAFGDYIYFNVTGLSREDTSQYIRKYLRMNLSTLETNEMELEDGRWMKYPNLLGDNLVFQTARKEDGNIDYYKTDYNGENPELFMTVSKNERLFTDGTYVYIDNRYELLEGNEDTRCFKVYNSALELIDTVTFSFENSGHQEFLCLDDKAFIFIEKTDLGGIKITALDKSQLGSVNGLWQRKTCYNTDADVEITNAPGALSNSAPYGSDTLVDLWQKAKDKEYGVKDSFQSDGAEAEGGFSVRLIWEQEGGTFTAYFPFMEFENENKAKGYINTNPYALQKGNIVVNIGVESVPQEVYDMLSSILDGAPVTPIDSKDFSGENFVFE